MSSKEFIPFIHMAYPLKVNQERATVITMLARTVTDILPHYGIPKEASRSVICSEDTPFYKSVTSNIFPVMHNLNDLADKVGIDIGDTFTLLTQVLKESMDALNVTFIYAPRLNDTILEAKVQLEFSRGGPSFENTYTEEQPSITGGYEMARANFKSVETRLVWLYAIPLLLRSDRTNSYREVRLDDFELIRSMLWQQRTKFLLDMLMFGSLLGEDELKEATQLVVNKKLYDPGRKIRYSVIEYIQPNGTSPYSYSSETEDKLFESIKTAYNKLND